MNTCGYVLLLTVLLLEWLKWKHCSNTCLSCSVAGAVIARCLLHHAPHACGCLTCVPWTTSLEQAIGRVTRKTGADEDEEGVVTLMCHVDIDKYRKCAGDPQRIDAALRHDLSRSGRGNFAVMVYYLLALQEEDQRHEAIVHLAEAVRNSARNSAEIPTDGTEPSNPRRRDVSMETSRMQFDFSLAPDFQYLLQLEDEQVDGSAGARQEGSAFLKGLVVPGSVASDQAANQAAEQAAYHANMLKELARHVEQHGPLPEPGHPFYRETVLGRWCLDCRYGGSIFPTGVKFGKWMPAFMAFREWGGDARVPGWQWDISDMEWVHLLKRYRTENGVFPLKWRICIVEKPLRDWMGKIRKERRCGTLDKKLEQQLDQLEGWAWEPPTSKKWYGFSVGDKVRLVAEYVTEHDGRLPDQKHDRHLLYKGYPVHDWAYSWQHAHQMGTLDRRTKQELVIALGSRWTWWSNRPGSGFGGNMAPVDPMWRIPGSGVYMEPGSGCSSDGTQAKRQQQDGSAVDKVCM